MIILMVSCTIGGEDSTFSIEPQEFRRMVEDIRVVEEALGQVILMFIFSMSLIDTMSVGINVKSS